MKKSILIIDDKDFVREDLKYMIKRKYQDAVEISEAVSGNKAIAKMKEATPDLVITDWEMTDGNGALVCAFCQQRNINVIICAGYYEPAVAKLGIPLVIKPYLKNVLPCIETYFKEEKDEENTKIEMHIF